MSDQPNVDGGEDIAAYIASLESMIESTEGTDYGGGCWIDLYGSVNETDPNGVVIAKHVTKINMTSHARTPEGALRNLMAGIKTAMTDFNMKPYNPSQPTHSAPAAAKPATAMAPTAPAARAAAPAPAAPSAPAPARAAAPAPAAPAAAAPSNNDVIIADRFEVTKRADGKADVKFYGTGDRFPRITVVRQPDTLAKMFAEGTGGAWTADHFNQPGVYNVRLIIHWEPSTTMNKNGQPYKNVTKVEGA